MVGRDPTAIIDPIGIAIVPEAIVTIIAAIAAPTGETIRAARPPGLSRVAIAQLRPGNGIVALDPEPIDRGRSVTGTRRSAARRIRSASAGCRRKIAVTDCARPPRLKARRRFQPSPRRPISAIVMQRNTATSS